MKQGTAYITNATLRGNIVIFFFEKMKSDEIFGIVIFDESKKYGYNTRIRIPKRYMGFMLELEHYLKETNENKIASY